MMQNRTMSRTLTNITTSTRLKMNCRAWHSGLHAQFSASHGLPACSRVVLRRPVVVTLAVTVPSDTSKKSKSSKNASKASGGSKGFLPGSKSDPPPFDFKLTKKGSKRATKSQVKMPGRRVGKRRLSVALAEAGAASRRGAEDIIRQGRVKVNGTLAELPQTQVDPEKDAITLDGKPLNTSKSNKLFYLAVNKPRGYVCTREGRNQHRETKLVDDLLHEWQDKWNARNNKRTAKVPVLPPRLSPVDRLDCGSTGLLLVTNDGRWAQQVAHPKSGLTHEYVLTTQEPVTRRQLKAVSEGVAIDGKEIKPKEAIVLQDKNSSNSSRCRLQLVLHADTRPNQVLKLMEKVGVRVKSVKRTRVGGLRLGRLALGQTLELKQNEAKQVLDKSRQGGQPIN